MYKTFSNPHRDINIKNLRVNVDFLRKIRPLVKSKSPADKIYFKNRRKQGVSNDNIKSNNFGIRSCKNTPKQKLKLIRSFLIKSKNFAQKGIKINRQLKSPTPKLPKLEKSQQCRQSSLERFKSTNKAIKNGKCNKLEESNSESASNCIINKEMKCVCSQEQHHIHDKIKQRIDEAKSSRFAGLKSSRILLKKLIKDNPDLIMKIFSDINKRDGIRSETYNKEYISIEDQDEL